MYVILSCEKYISTRYKSQRETWLQNKEYICLSVKEDLENHIVGWNTDDTYNGCSRKYLEFFKNMDIDSDWYIFVDDDTFVYTDRLEDYLQQFDPNQRFYIGYRFSNHTSMSGGAGFVISKPVYKDICNYVRTNTINLTSIYTDETLFEWLKHISPVKHISDTRFHWRNAMNIEEQHSAFTFHYVSPQNMYMYYREQQEKQPKMDISILIPTMKPRERLFQNVLTEVQKQISECPEIRVEVLWESDNGELTLGQKRNVLMDRCNGKYHCFIDDDDILAPYFLRTFVPMIQSGIDYDCASFLGAHYVKGKFNKLFYHSMDIGEWHETSDRFFRSTSPMNLIKTSIVRQVRYKDIRNTEDHEFSKRLMKSGLLKNEFKIPDRPIYHYIDGVKQDREEWKHSWNGDRVFLFKQSSFHPESFKLSSYSSFTGNLSMPYTNLFQRK